MNGWSNNYYTQQAVRDTPRPSQGLTSSPFVSRSRRNSLAKTDNGVVKLCVFRVAHLTQITLRSFIERQDVRVLDIEQTSHNGTAYRSFVVTVAEKDAPKLLNKGFWPGLVACRTLEDDEPLRNEVFSRRNARESIVIPASRTGDSSPHRSRRNSTMSGALLDKPRSVQQVTGRPYDTNSTDEQVRKERKRANRNYLKVIEGKNDREPTSLQKEKLPAVKKNGLGEKGSKSVMRKIGKSPKVTRKAAIIKVKRKISDESNHERKEPPRTSTVKAKRKQSDENKVKKQNPSDTEKGRARTPFYKTARTRKSSVTNFPNPTKNRKLKTEGDTSSRNSNSERTSDQEISEGKTRPQKPDISPLRVPTVNKKYTTPSSQKPTENKENFSKPQEIQSNWLKPMQALLKVSSEEAMERLLGPEFDGLIIQENISDRELFLGVRLLAHCARADVEPTMQQNLVYRICQPQIITLIKEFTRTVEEKYKERAESYFWHLGEFLDLYIVHEIFLQGMLSLFTTCLSKILALSYRKYVSMDLVKVYRGMHSKVFTNLP